MVLIYICKYVQNKFEMPELNEAQNRILEKIAKTPGEITAYQISVELNKEPSAVARSVQLMAENHLLKIVEPKKGVAKPLELTDKGALYAVHYCKVDYYEIVSNHKNIENLSDPYVRSKWQEIKDNGVSDIFGQVLAKISVQNNLFNEDTGAWLLDPLREDYSRNKHWYIPIVLEMTAKFVERWKELHKTDKEFNDLISWWVTYSFKGLHVQKPKEIYEVAQVCRRR